MLLPRRLSVGASDAAPAARGVADCSPKRKNPGTDWEIRRPGQGGPWRPAWQGPPAGRPRHFRDRAAEDHAGAAPVGAAPVLSPGNGPGRAGWFNPRRRERLPAPYVEPMPLARACAAFA